MAAYTLTPFHDSELGDDMPDQWTLMDYTLAQSLDVPTNYSAERLVAALLPDELAGRVRFASEAGCFFAHADTRTDLDAVAALIADLVAQVSGPDAPPPGSMLDSVASPHGRPVTGDHRSWRDRVPDVPCVTLSGTRELCPGLDAVPAGELVCGCGTTGDFEVVEPVSAPLEPFVRLLVRCRACQGVSQAVSGPAGWWAP